MRAGGAARVGRIDPLDRPGRDRLVADVERQERLAPRRPAREVRIEGNARKLAAEVQRIGLAI